jgi:hypothetical protein
MTDGGHFAGSRPIIDEEEGQTLSKSGTIIGASDAEEQECIIKF